MSQAVRVNKMRTENCALEVIEKHGWGQKIRVGLRKNRKE